DRPVVAYGFGRGGFGQTSATLLWPQESWGTTTVVSTPPDSLFMNGSYAMVVAADDDTEVLFRPTEDIVDIDEPKQIVRRGVTKRVRLRAVEFAQIAIKETRPQTGYETPYPPLSGSIAVASKP